MEKWIETINEDIRETKNLIKAVQNQADATWEEARQAKRQADASWEFVNIVRNDLKRPLWKKWFGIN